MDKEEMRFIRRDYINRCFYHGLRRLSFIKELVRNSEKTYFGEELKAYK